MRTGKITIATIALTAIMVGYEMAIGQVVASPVMAFCFAISMIADLFAARRQLGEEEKKYLREVVLEVLATEVKK